MQISVLLLKSNNYQVRLGLVNVNNQSGLFCLVVMEAGNTGDQAYPLLESQAVSGFKMGLWQKLNCKHSVSCKVSYRCQGPNLESPYSERAIYTDIQNSTWNTETGGFTEEKPHHDKGYGLSATSQAHESQEMKRLIPDFMIMLWPLRP